MTGLRRIFSDRCRRPGFCRVAVVLVALALPLPVAGCGGESDSATRSEKDADVETLNALLAQELTVVDAYADARLLRGAFVAVGRHFRAQDEEHVNAVTKAIRGLGGETDAETAELEAPSPKTQAELLALAYEQENAALAAFLDAVPQFNTPAPRTLAASIAANHAQHLVVLRQGLGAGLAASVPEAFEPGDLPPPQG